MSELNANLIDIVSHQELTRRRREGIYASLDKGDGLKVVDCGDDRAVTEPVARIRMHVYGMHHTPGRLFGGVFGIVVSSMATRVAEQGATSVIADVGTLNAESIAELNAHTSTVIRNKKGIDLMLHSDQRSENNLTKLSENENPLGCAAVRFAHLVATLGTNDIARQQARDVNRRLDLGLPVDDAHDAMGVVAGMIPPREVHRDPLLRMVRSKELYVPTTVLAGEHQPATEAALSLDFAGMRSDGGFALRNNLKRYHHTPELVPRLAPVAFPEHHDNSDQKLQLATSLVHALGVRQALSGETSPYSLRLELIAPQSDEAA